MIGAFSHETNSFSPEPANRAAFEKRRLYFGDEIFERIAGEENEMNGYLDVLQRKTDVQIVPSIAFSAGPSGPVTADVYDLAERELLKTIREQGPFDGLLLNLHGAMVSEHHRDAEGDLLETLRKEVGSSVPIVVTLDLHANITAKMAKNADALIPCAKYPHTDCYELGRSAAKLMYDTLKGDVQPVMAFRPIPYLLPLFPTDMPEILPFVKEAERIECNPDILFARIAHGFFPANIPGMGMAVVVIADGKRDLAENFADKLASDIWNGRDGLKRKYTPLDDALELAEKGAKAPVVLGDGSDNPGAGGLCDTTHILKRIMERKIRGAAIAVIRDAESVQICRESGAGGFVSLSVGGKSDPRLSGGPVPLQGKVIRLTDGVYRNRDEMEKGVLVNMGPCAVVETAGNLLILSSERCQVLDAEGFRSCGIIPEEQKILVVKSAVHYRQSFGKFAGALVDLALPGYAAPDPDIFRSLGFSLG